jgi:hypothetical protein
MTDCARGRPRSGGFARFFRQRRQKPTRSTVFIWVLFDLTKYLHDTQDQTAV